MDDQKLNLGTETGRTDIPEVEGHVMPDIATGPEDLVLGAERNETDLASGAQDIAV